MQSVGSILTDFRFDCFGTDRLAAAVYVLFSFGTLAAVAAVLALQVPYVDQYGFEPEPLLTVLGAGVACMLLIVGARLGTELLQTVFGLVEAWSQRTVSRAEFHHPTRTDDQRSTVMDAMLRPHAGHSVLVPLLRLSYTIWFVLTLVTTVGIVAVLVLNAVWDGDVVDLLVACFFASAAALYTFVGLAVMRIVHEHLLLAVIGARALRDVWSHEDANEVTRRLRDHGRPSEYVKASHAAWVLSLGDAALARLLRSAEIGDANACMELGIRLYRSKQPIAQELALAFFGLARELQHPQAEAVLAKLSADA